ncbi:collagen-binding domain-containing protein [Paludisphaera sp.]|uniref:collagen-binding domain-containing protein n=1 Tax=Paludisphaera sp. TaxID=2017432 RepID=UPI00301BF93C
MMRKASLFILPFSLAAPAVRADLLRDWNVVVTGNAYVRHETEGPVRVGGDLNVVGGQYGIKPRAGTMAGSGVGLMVGGNVVGAQHGGVKLDQGANAVIGGASTPTNVFANGPATVDDASVRGIGASDAALLRTYSDGFKALAPTNSFQLNDVNNKGLFVVAANSVGNAVFNVQAADVFGDSRLGSLVLDLNGRQFADGESVIINVAGEVISFLGGRNFDGDFNTPDPDSPNVPALLIPGNPHVIWNFYEATVIDMLRGNFKGAMLAPNAILKNTNTIDGGVFVRQLGTSANPFDGQDAEIHPPLYRGYVPTTAAPEPSSMAMAAIALAAGGLYARRRRRDA